MGSDQQERNEGRSEKANGRPHESGFARFVQRLTSHPYSELLLWIFGVLGGISLLLTLSKPAFGLVANSDLFALASGTRTAVTFLGLGGLAFGVVALVKFAKNTLGVALISFGAMCTLIVNFQDYERAEGEVVFLYDRTKPSLHPTGGVGYRSLPVQEFQKVAQVQGVRTDSTFITAMETPVASLLPVWQTGFEPTHPILSFVEVIEHQDERITDVSFSNFVAEIAYYFSTTTEPNQSILILFEDRFIDARGELRAQLLQIDGSLDIQSLVFEQDASYLDLPTHSSLVFLGSSDAYEKLSQTLSEDRMQITLLPSWLGRAASKHPLPGKGDTYLMVSSPLASILDQAAEEWDEILDTIEAAKLNGESVENALTARVVASKTIIAKEF